MNDDDLMFHWGIGLAAGMLMMTAVLQVCFRVQDKARADARTQIVRTQQDTAAAAAGFASYVRPEILRNLVAGVNSKSSVISFNKSITIAEIPWKSEQTF